MLQFEAKNQYGHTPLITAASRGHPEVLELLLMKGASIQATNNSHNTPLHLAALLGHKAAVELLLEKGASTEAKNEQGNTPLVSAAASGRTGVVGVLLAICIQHLHMRIFRYVVPMHTSMASPGLGTIDTTENLIEEGYERVCRQLVHACI